MKKIILLFLAGFLLFSNNAFGALTKAVASLDAWQAVAQNVVVKGATADVSANYQTTLYIDCALTSETAQANGTEIRVQVSTAASGDNSWIDLTSFGGPTGTANSEASTANPLTAASTTITCASTTGYTLPTGTDNGLRFILDATIANSEIVFQNGLITNTNITIVDGTTTQHANTAVLYNIVAEYVVNIPDTANRVRVIYNNTKDASGSTVAVRARLTTITGI